MTARDREDYGVVIPDYIRNGKNCESLENYSLDKYYKELDEYIHADPDII